MSDIAAIAERLRTHFTAQEQRYRSILELADAQLAAIRDRDSSRLMPLLARKQDIIRQIDEADRAAAADRQAWEAGRETAIAPVRDRLAESFNRLTTTMREVIAVEDESRSTLTRGQDSAKDEILRIQKGKQMHKAYGAGIPLKSRFTDKTR